MCDFFFIFSIPLLSAGQTLRGFFCPYKPGRAGHTKCIFQEMDVPNMPGIGKQSLVFERAPIVVSHAAAAGKKEAEGPLGKCFDYTTRDDRFGQKTWEKAESRLQQLAFELACKKLPPELSGPDVIFAGDLLNQCIGSAFAARETGIPFLGLYGACSTMAESLLLAASFVNAGYVRCAAAVTSSHFASAERQYRFPLGYGGQRTPTAQWTVTGSGCCILASSGQGPCVKAATIGRIQDFGVTDANNMGAAMAPAAVDTIRAHLEDLSRAPEDYDWIVTGDLGRLGSRILLEKLSELGIELGARHMDCGLMIFDTKRQDVHAGGSGCGCSASVLCGGLLRALARGEAKRLLFCATGALLSPVSCWQGESIPGICHAVSIEA